MVENGPSKTAREEVYDVQPVCAERTAIRRTREQNQINLTTL